MQAAIDGLNAAQRAAVTHPGGPLLVLAGAGTGKTRTLTRRFAWLVEQGMPADELLALTFSAAAAAEMRERLETLLDRALRGAARRHVPRLLHRACCATRRSRPGSTRSSRPSPRPTGWRCCSSASTSSRSATTRSAATRRRCSRASSRGSTG